MALKFSNIFNRSSSTPSDGYRVQSARMRNISKKLPLVLVVVVILAGMFFLVKSISSKQTSAVSNSDGKIKVQDAKASKNLNYELLVPVKDEKDKELTKIKYTIENAELRDEIVVKGKRGSAVAGREFLVFNVKLVNDFNRNIEVNAKDFIRISVDGSNEWLAPEIHNDPVNVQAISTKYTRVGIAVDDDKRNFKVQVGEINGEKKVIDLNF